LQNNVKPTDILLENKAKNTMGNARYTRKILEANGLTGSRLLLVTSAFHIPRAMMCFRKAGLKVQPYPCAYLPTYTDTFSFENIIPDESAFGLWYFLFKEWFGIAIYKLVGYV
jgi:uncharacterized SAM-binding protein YcdF (DUF218 family)